MVSCREAERRIAEDDGDAADVVHVLGGTSRTAYHDARDCHALINDDRRTKATARRIAQSRLRPPCRSCVLVSDSDDVGGYEMPSTRFADVIEADQERRQREREQRPTPLG